VYVQFVAPGSAGDQAGIRQNDRIISIGSNAVSSIDDYKAILGMTTPGAIIPLVISRGGTTLSVKINMKPQSEAGSP
jgi:S1-C subfamily serine protease